MKLVSLVLALVLALIALSFILVRSDILQAEYLRYLPSIIAIIVAGGVAFLAIRRRQGAKNRPNRRSK